MKEKKKITAESFNNTLNNINKINNIIKRFYFNEIVSEYIK